MPLYPGQPTVREREEAAKKEAAAKVRERKARRERMRGEGREEVCEWRDARGVLHREWRRCVRSRMGEDGVLQEEWVMVDAE